MNRRRAQSASSNHSSDMEEQGYRSNRGSIDESSYITPGHTAGSGIGATSTSTSSSQFRRESLGVIFEDKEDDGAVYNPVLTREKKDTTHSATPSTSSSHAPLDGSYATVPTSTSTSKYEV